jgi:hypothetical protein
VVSACTSTKNVSLKHPDPAMVAPARFDQELTDCRVWAAGAAEGEDHAIPSDVAEYAVSLCLRAKGYVTVDDEGKHVDEPLFPPTLAMTWGRSGTTAEVAGRDGMECSRNASMRSWYSRTESFRAYWDSYLLSFGNCMQGRGYQCTGRDCP